MHRVPSDDATRRLTALLAPLTNYERTRPDRPRFTLDTMRALLARLGDAARPPGLVVQVGGSKGKGTTAAYLEALARADGWRVGVYSSPHVSTILERVRLDGREVGEEALTDACRRVLAVRDGLDPAPSFFEVMTAAALLRFADQRVDLAVLEVGLGGRLDATTACPVDASVLTSVELEHTDLLGETVEAIAGEKAWILRPGRIGLHALSGAAAAVVEAHATRVGCTLLALGREFHCASEVTSEGVRAVRLDGPAGAEARVELRGAPPWEDAALALAWGCLTALRRGFRPPCTLERPRLPGRFERRVDADGGELILDGAHTVASARQLAGALRERFGPGRANVLFGSSRGKRWREFLAELLEIAARFVVVPLSGTATEEPADVVDWLRGRGATVEAAPDAEAGLARLRAEAGPRVVTGSFYLVGEVRDRLPDAADPG